MSKKDKMADETPKRRGVSIPPTVGRPSEWRGSLLLGMNFSFIESRHNCILYFILGLGRALNSA